jgi:hypothetical protein
MLGIPAELEEEIVSRLSWSAVKALARVSKAGCDAARQRVLSLEWDYRSGPPPLVDLLMMFPAARRLALAASDTSGPQGFFAAKGPFLAQLEHLQLFGMESAAVVDRVLLLDTIAAQCPRLQDLDALGTFFPQLQPLAALTQLTRLQLDGSESHRHSYSALTSAISGLTGLKLHAWDFDINSSSELRGTTALQRLSRLELNVNGQADFGCLAAIPSLRCLRLTECLFEDEPSSLSRLTMLEELALDCGNAGKPFQIPIGALAALTSLRSLELHHSTWLNSTLAFKRKDLGQQQLQQLQHMLAGLDRLSGLGRIHGVGDPQLLGCIGCTQLEFEGFEGCAEPAAGAAPPLPRLSSLRLTSRQQQLDPLVLLQRGLTSLSLRHVTDASCQQLPQAFPQLRVLQLGCGRCWRPSPGPSAAGLAHLGALQQLQQLHLVHPQLKLPELQQLAAITGLRRLLIQVMQEEEPGDDDAPVGRQPASALEPVLTGLAASSALKQLLLVAYDSISLGRREALQAACDRVVAGSGRQDLVVGQEVE